MKVGRFIIGRSHWGRRTRPRTVPTPYHYLGFGGSLVLGLLCFGLKSLDGRPAGLRLVVVEVSGGSACLILLTVSLALLKSLLRDFLPSLYLLLLFRCFMTYAPLLKRGLA